MDAIVNVRVHEKYALIGQGGILIHSLKYEEAPRHLCTNGCSYAGHKHVIQPDNADLSETFGATQQAVARVFQFCEGNLPQGRIALAAMAQKYAFKYNAKCHVSAHTWCMVWNSSVSRNSELFAR